MEVFVDASQSDDLLLPFLAETDEGAEALLLSRLIAEQVEPTVKRVLAYKLQFYVNQGGSRFKNQDVEEVYNDIHVYLLKRLRDLKETPSARPISNLRGYVTTIARNTCDEYLRRKYPQRRYLKDKIRHHLTGQREFGLGCNFCREI
jgi:DNA-directed RNA polymerase specialized sigma24 family protein